MWHGSCLQTWSEVITERGKPLSAPGQDAFPRLGLCRLQQPRSTGCCFLGRGILIDKHYNRNNSLALDLYLDTRNSFLKFIF